MCRYIEEIKAKNKSKDGLFYAGHPVNAYNLIKRWYRLSSMTPNTDNYQGMCAIYNILPMKIHRKTCTSCVDSNNKKSE